MCLLYADPTRSRCKPQSRSVQIEFYDFGKDAPWQQAFARVYSTLRGVSPARCLIANLPFRVAHVGGLRGLRN